jgi:hypothetical protein
MNSQEGEKTMAAKERTMECLEPYLGVIHLQKVDSAFLGPFEHAGGQECPK